MRYKLKHDLRLTDAEVATIANWSKNGTPEGDPAKAPAKGTFTDVRLTGVTDTLAIKPYKLAASNNDELRCFPVDPKATADTTWIDGSSVVPGDPRVVHHVLVYVDPKRESVAKAGADGSYPCFGGPGVSEAGLVMAWAPGGQPMDLAPEAAMPLPKDAMLVVQMHYHPVVEATDTTKIELRRRESPPKWRALVALIGNADDAKSGLLPSAADPTAGPQFVIPAGAKSHVESMTFTIPPMIDGKITPELRIHSVASHMHWVGRDMKIEVERSIVSGDDPANECLLGTPKYDFNWQRFYQFDAAIEDLPMVRAGDKLKMTCTYDNSMGNPFMVKALKEQKLSAPIDVKLGEQTLDEMCLGAFVVLQRN